MARHRRLSASERTEILRRRAAGAPVKVLAVDFGVTQRSIYYLLRAAQSRQADGQARSELVNVRLTVDELRTFDAALSRHDISSRADGLRRLIQVANGVFVPDEHMADQLAGLSAALNRTGNNVNQIAQRLNESRRKGQRLPYGQRSEAPVRRLAGLIFEIADQVHEMAQRRRAGLQLEINKALEGFADGP